MITADGILKQLAEIPDLKAKARFYGTSLYQGAVLFGLIIDGRLYFKVNYETLKDYELFGMKAYDFKPVSQDLFYEVPPKVLAKDHRLVLWAKKAIAVAAAV